ncbi:MAG: prepilin-type N-terminal cleavage/methylation domain-containing protein [Candidatus Gracilibacteria bacterium]|nr:prepilin-type N-terminal cleavage/methylation domain-containing protein [Candidatus Gracilibacteria bacterium]
MHPTPNNKNTDVTFQHPHHKQMKNFLGFTLIELIVVITILVILGTIAFVNLGGFQSSARDSSRVENLSNLKKGLDMFQIKTGSYPMPEGSVIITASGTTIVSYQGFAKDGVGSMARLSPGATQDPLDTSIYTTYSVNADRTKMELMNFLEDGSTLLSLNAFVPNASADIGSDYSKRYPSVQGDTLGILLASGTLQPIQESGTGVDVVKTTTLSGYVMVFGKNDTSLSIPTSGTGAYTGSLFTFIYNKRSDLLNIKTLASLDSSLVGYWDMETMSGTKLRDWSRYGNDGTLSGTTSVQGKYGYSRSFNGVSEYVDISNSIANVKSLSEGTISGWFKTNVNSAQTLFDLYQDDAHLVQIMGPGNWTSSFADESFGYASYNSGSLLMFWVRKGNYYYADGKWHQFTVNAGNGDNAIYIDGQREQIVFSQGTKETRNMFLNIGNPTFSAIGVRQIAASGASIPFNGIIDELRIYNRALSDSEIKALYNATR